MYKEHQMSNRLFPVNLLQQMFKKPHNSKDQELNKFMSQIIDTIIIKLLMNINTIFLVWLMSHGIDVFKSESVVVFQETNVLLNNLEEERGIGIDFLFCFIFFTFYSNWKMKKIKNKFV